VPLLHRLALAAILLYGAFARFDALTWGLPAQYHPDERGGTMAVSACRHGRPYARRYQHPPLLYRAACAVDEYVVGPYAARNRLRFPHTTLSLRLVSAAGGTLTVGLAYLLALRFVTPAGALAGALLVACFPSLVVASKYGVPDSLLTMLMTAALWLQMRMLERPEPLRYFVAALVTALAVTAKYNGGFVAISFVAAHGASWWRGGVSFWSMRHIAGSAGAVLVGLLLGFPAVFLGGEAATLATGMLSEQQHLVGRGHHGITLGALEGGYVFHFRHSILPAAGALLTALILGGLVAMAAARRAGALVLMAFVVPYYLVIESIYKVPPSFERYSLPLVPVYLIGAALVLEHIAGAVRKRRAIALAATAALAAFVPVSRTSAVLASIGNDTRDAMGVWMRDHMEPGARVFAQWPETMRFYYPQRRHSPALLPASRGDLRQRSLGAPSYVLASSLLYQRYLDYPDDDPVWTSFYSRVMGEAELIHEEDAAAARYMFHNPTLRLYRLPDHALR
jgi:4-amino-4-deoxy-L-arabinose transferase-like glycosyltransferase